MSNKSFWSFLLSAVMLLGGITSVSASNNYSFEESFETETSAYTAEGCTAEKTSESKSGEAAVAVKDRENFNSGLVYELKNIPNNSKNEISVWVKAEESTETLRLYAEYTSTDGGLTKGTIAQTNARGGSWVKLSGTLSTKFKTVRGSIKIKIISIAREEKTVPCGYIVDDISVKSDSVSDIDKVGEVPAVEYDGNYTYRAAFDNFQLGNFKEMGTPMLEISDDTLPHTGTYSMKVSGRTASWHTVMLELPDFPKDASASVSVWVKTPEATGTLKFSLQVGGISDGMRTIASASVKENTWTNITGAFSIKGITPKSNVKLQITTGEPSTNQEFTDFYVDDFLLKSDTAGELKDDMADVAEEVRPEGVSDTPYKKSALPVEIQSDIVSLKDAMSPYFKMGAAFVTDSVSTSNFDKLVRKHFNVGTPEGPFHMYSVRKEDGTYDFTKADKFMDYCMKNNIEVVGHALIWDHANQKKYITKPDGTFISREEAIALLEEHIKTMSEHFNNPSKGWKIRGWDVVNEAVLDTRPDELKSYAGWSTILGEDYLYYAYKFAEKYNPDSELYYNDYGLINPMKRDSVYNLIKRLLERGCKIDAIGMQSHYSMDFDPYQVRCTIEKFKSLGVRVEITELDISAYTTAQMKDKKPLYDKGILQSVEDLQTWYWYELFSIYREYSDIINRVTTWGVYDGKSFRNTKEFVKVEYPLLFDREFQAKDAFWAIVNPQEYEAKTGLDKEYQKLNIYNEEKKVEFADGDLVMDGDILYAPLRKTLESFGIQMAYSEPDNSVTIIKNGKMLKLRMDSTEGELDFAPVNTAGKMIISEDGTAKAPIEGILKLLGYATRWNEYRHTLFVYNI